MPNFSTTPPPDSENSGFRLIRTPPIAKITAHVISEQLTGCSTHFVGNRTVPCESPNCDPCASGIARRWHGYLLILMDSTQETVIFEMTKKAASAFQEYHQRHGTLRGCHFQASRLNQKPNGRVLIHCKTGDLTRVTLPRERSVERLMCHIWNIPPLQVEAQPVTPARTTPGLKVNRANPEIKGSDEAPTPIVDAINQLDASSKDNGSKTRQAATDKSPPGQPPRLFRQ